MKEARSLGAITALPSKVCPFCETANPIESTVCECCGFSLIEEKAHVIKEAPPLENGFCDLYTYLKKRGPNDMLRPKLKYKALELAEHFNASGLKLTLPQWGALLETFCVAAAEEEIRETEYAVRISNLTSTIDDLKAEKSRAMRVVETKYKDLPAKLEKANTELEQAKTEIHTLKQVNKGYATALAVAALTAISLFIAMIK